MHVLHSMCTAQNQQAALSTCAPLWPCNGRRELNAGTVELPLLVRNFVTHYVAAEGVYSL